MKLDKKGNAVKIHKTYFRKILRDERLTPRLRLMAQLFLAYIEEVIPHDLLGSVIESEYGLKNKNKAEEIPLEEAIDKAASSGLKQQWKELVRGDDGNTSISTTGQ